MASSRWHSAVVNDPGQALRRTACHSYIACLSSLSLLSIYRSGCWIATHLPIVIRLPYHHPVYLVNIAHSALHPAPTATIEHTRALHAILSYRHQTTF